MRTIPGPEKVWYAYGNKLWSKIELCAEALKFHRYRWFKDGKVERALDFDWTVVVSGNTVSQKYVGLTLMRRTWQSLKERLPEKANMARLRMEKAKVEGRIP